MYIEDPKPSLYREMKEDALLDQEALLCPLCFEDLEAAVLCNRCGQQWCGVCHELWRHKQWSESMVNTCPFCRRLLTPPPPPPPPPAPVVTRRDPLLPYLIARIVLYLTILLLLLCVPIIDFYLKGTLLLYAYGLLVVLLLIAFFLNFRSYGEDEDEDDYADTVLS